MQEVIILTHFQSESQPTVFMIDLQIDGGNLLEKIVFAELIGGVSFQMLEDRKVVIVSDGSFFLVTTEEHSKEYPELNFEPVPDEEIVQYDLKNYSEKVWELLKPISLV